MARSVLARLTARLCGKRTDWDALGNEAVATHDARAAASRFSRGNVRVQLGHFVTPPDLEREAVAR